VRAASRSAWPGDDAGTEELCASSTARSGNPPVNPEHSLLADASLSTLSAGVPDWCQHPAGDGAASSGVPADLAPAGPASRIIWMSRT
jgi:hypothetical protein